jgi:hypothetical protein
MKRALLSLVILLTISLSGYSTLRAIQETPHPGTPVTVTPLGPKRSGPRMSFTSNSGIGDPLRIVIRDGDAWREMWKRIHSPDADHDPISELPPLPEIDFSREIVVVVASGARANGGYAIIVDGAYERDDRLEIVVRSVSPGKGCFNVQMVTQPVDIVRLPKTERSVVFRENEVVHECK